MLSCSVQLLGMLFMALELSSAGNLCSDKKKHAENFNPNLFQHGTLTYTMWMDKDRNGGDGDTRPFVPFCTNDTTGLLEPNYFSFVMFYKGRDIPFVYKLSSEPAIMVVVQEKGENETTVIYTTDNKTYIVYYDCFGDNEEYYLTYKRPEGKSTLPPKALQEFKEMVAFGSPYLKGRVPDSSFECTKNLST